MLSANEISDLNDLKLGDLFSSDDMTFDKFVARLGCEKLPDVGWCD